jgi:drug/metabolite transporter (DMT)-like permease
MRHVLAFIGFAPFYGRFRRLNRFTFVAAAVIAVALYLMIAFLSYGLQVTTSNEGAFLSTFYVVFTPFLGYAVLKARVKKQHVAGISIAMAGLVIMLFGNTGPGANILAFNYGDVLVLFAALFNTVQIVLLEKYSNKVDIVLFSMVQVAILAALQLGTSAIIQEKINFGNIDGFVIFDWIYLGIVNSALTLLIQAWSQKFIEANRAALLYAMEPIFALFFGISVGGEPLTIAFVTGAGLIMAGILLSSARRKKLV